jgi:hypothetical protein
MSRKPEDSGETPLTSPFQPAGVNGPSDGEPQFQAFQGFAEVFSWPLSARE